MNMECFSICLCPLWFRWAVVCSSPWRGPLRSCELNSKVFYSFCSNCEWQFVLDLALFQSVIGVGMLVIFAHWFCILRLLKLLISLRSFWAEVMGFSRYRTMSSAKRDNLTSSHFIWMHLFLFLLWIALANTMFNRNSERRHPCLMADFKGNASSFFPFSIILAVGFS